MTPQELVARNITLVSLPEVCMQVQMLADLPSTTAADLANVINNDTALTARLLKLVNSAFFNTNCKVETISRAVNLIGMRELRNLTLAASAAEVFSDIPVSLIDMAAFWQHSVYTGLIACNLASECNVLHGERLFTAGILHDIGRLLMLMKLPEDMGKAEILRRSNPERDICEIERELLDFDHAEVGAALLKEWNLPTNLYMSVHYHHNPRDAHDAHLEAALLHIANQVTHCAQESKDSINSPFYDPYGALLDADLSAELISKNAIETIQPEAMALTKLNEDHFAKAISASAMAFSQVLDLLYPMAWETR